MGLSFIFEPGFPDVFAKHTQQKSISREVKRKRIGPYIFEIAT
jgi:hypothetical protein